MKKKRGRPRKVKVTLIELTDSTRQMIDYPHILDKLTDPTWRKRLEKLCSAFKESHYPKYNEDVFFCEDGFPLNIACDWLECTQ